MSLNFEQLNTQNASSVRNQRFTTSDSGHLLLFLQHILTRYYRSFRDAKQYRTIRDLPVREYLRPGLLRTTIGRFPGFRQRAVSDAAGENALLNVAEFHLNSVAATV